MVRKLFLVLSIFLLLNSHAHPQQELDSNADDKMDLILLPTVDEDNMSSDSETLLPTQQSVKAYADTKQTDSATLTTLAAISYSDNMLSFFAAADYAAMRTAMEVLAIAGGTVTGSVTLNDNDGASPSVAFQDETDETVILYKPDTEGLSMVVDNASDRDFNIQNDGAGDANLLVYGTISEGGTVLSDLYEGQLTNSAGLKAALSDETGDGANVHAESPTLVTPVLGVATATSIQGDLLIKWNTAEPDDLEVGQFYGAVTPWDPTGTGQTGNHVVWYTNDSPDTWVLVRDDAGTWYFSSISVSSIAVPSYTHHAGADYPYNDTTGNTHDLIGNELKGTIITNCGATADKVYQLIDTVADMNFMVMTCVTTAGQGKMSLDPYTGEELWLNGVQMDANELIENDADSKGDIMSCWSVETGDGTFELFCKSDNANFVQETP